MLYEVWEHQQGRDVNCVGVAHSSREALSLSDKYSQGGARDIHVLVFDLETEQPVYRITQNNGIEVLEH